MDLRSFSFVAFGTRLSACGHLERLNRDFDICLMTILGIGVDVVHVTRILALINRRSPKLLAIRILSAKEMEEWGDVGSADITSQARFLAVR